jgi:hypothetical protein
VGGRNLFRKGYLSNGIVNKFEVPLDALQPREGDNTYTLSLDYKISPEDKASSPRITCFYTGNKNIFWDSKVVRDGEWHHKEYTIKLDIDESKYPIYGWFTDYGSANGRTIDMVAVRNIKLERGSIATDWTPAPEDVAESVSTVNTSLVSLASTLLDPNEGDIPQLFRQLDKHKTDTDKSFAELNDHPLTIDDNGYWQIWDLKQKKYLTTQYPSRGEDAGRYLGRAKRIHPDFNGNYLLEPEGSSWQTAKEGDYVYLVGDLSNRGGDKDTYYIVREHKSKTVWEVYNIKGHSPSPESVLGTTRFAELLTQQVETSVDPKINKIKSGTLQIANNIQSQLCELGVLSISDSGYVKVKQLDTCPAYTDNAYVAGDMPPIEPKTHQIQLALKSDVAALSSTVTKLQGQLQRLAASTHITPIANTDLRKQGGGSTLYPQYGDWLLTSDSAEQFISFAGLPGEIGRSIYIQTRKRVYLYANGHSFNGLPGTDKSISVNQWLAHNTTYRFVRASASMWFVTASSSPYPWT